MLFPFVMDSPYIPHWMGQHGGRCWPAG